MFSLKDFLKKGFINAVGKMADYQIILNAAGWFEKGVFVETDLADIQAEIDKHNIEKEKMSEEIAKAFETDMVLE